MNDTLIILLIVIAIAVAGCRWARMSWGKTAMMLLALPTILVGVAGALHMIFVVALRLIGEGVTALTGMDPTPVIGPLAIILGAALPLWFTWRYLADEREFNRRKITTSNSHLTLGAAEARRTKIII